MARGYVLEGLAVKQKRGRADEGQAAPKEIESPRLTLPIGAPSFALNRSSCRSTESLAQVEQAR